ncbi:MAG: UvrD-helicase domain-containing protein, partial [Parvularcula sp.]|nr:UvrD-helicase domain-containing protein [Parvularcula sp.]
MSDRLSQTAAIQRRVADPSRSAWVSANSGTGKTYVLVRRVIRQLLAGAKPNAILCITYTKAAAAEMSVRLLSMLSKWALLSDDELRENVQAETGLELDDNELSRARKLFAQSLEVPGGLKIQTIHSFCGNLLGRFPTEAGLSVGVQPLEEDETEALRRATAEEVSQLLSQRNESDAATLREFAARFAAAQDGEDRRRKTLHHAFADAARFLQDLQFADGELLYPARLFECFGPGAVFDEDRLLAEWRDTVQRHRPLLRDLARRCSQAKGKKWNSLSVHFERCAEEPTDFSLVAEPPYYTESGALRAELRNPWTVPELSPLEEGFHRYHADCLAMQDRLRSCRHYAANVEFFYLAAVVLQVYEARKRERGLIDYEDLIRSALSLLRNTEMAWVRFRLDSGIDHILLDEAQDTTLAQWHLFDELVAEIAANADDAAGPDRQRSLFVVGDPKQSIYRFNGAEAALFTERRETFERQLAGRLATDRLSLSFRTSPAILNCVDAVFDQDDLRGFAKDYQRHDSHFEGRFGCVELWPVCPKSERPKYQPFMALSEDKDGSSGDQVLAEAIADDIAGRIASGEILACKDGRAVMPSDFLILFQRRNERFGAVHRALAAKGIPCAGADRVKMLEDTAVGDLLSLLRFAANTDDSLSLAVLLKSPFFGWSEEELFDLAAPRDEDALWRTLRKDASPRSKEAAAVLERALNAGARSGPFELITALIEGAADRATGHTALAARLGQDYRDAVEMFLSEAIAFEEGEPRSVHAFLARAEKSHKERKRELDTSSANGVRVMTAHGAKGLEAPIVYLADAERRQRYDSSRDPIVGVRTQDGRIVPVLLPSRKAEDCSRCAAWRTEEENRIDEEYRRLLYVGMTRAEERLIVCGAGDAKDGTWHRLVETAFAHLPEEAIDSRGAPWGGEIRIFSTGALPPVRQREEERSRAVEVPSWLHQSVKPEAASVVLYPSELPDEEEWTGEGLEAFGSHGGQAQARGLYVHRLLEHLPAVTADDRAERAQAL